MNSRNTLKLIQADSGRASTLRIPIHTLGGDRIRKIDNIYDLTPEIYETLSSTSYTGKAMKNENDASMMNKIKKDLGCTGRGDRQSNRKRLFTTQLPTKVEDIQNKTIDEITDSSDKLEGQGLKINNPSNIIDINTRLEVLLELKLSGRTVILTEANKLIDEFHKRGEIQNKLQYQNSLDKFSTH